MIHVTIRTLDSQNYAFDVEDDITVAGFKEKIAERTKITIDKQRLIFKGKVLQDDKILNSYSVQDQVIHMVEKAPPSSLAPSGASSSIDDPNHNVRTSRAPPRVFLGTVDIPIADGNFDMSRFENALHQFAQNISQPDVLHEQTLQPNIDIGNNFGPQFSQVNNPTTNQGNVSYSKQRLDIANKMIDEAKKEIIKLDALKKELASTTEKMSVDPNEPSTSHNISEDAEVKNEQGIDMIEDVLKEPPIPTTPANIDSATQGPVLTDVPQTAPGPNNRPHTSEMADLIDKYTGVLRDVLPYMDSTSKDLRRTEKIEDQGEKKRLQTEFDTVSRIIHYLSHAQHAMSDIVVDYEESDPRYLRAAVLHQAYLPIEVNMPYPLPQAAASPFMPPIVSTTNVAAHPPQPAQNMPTIAHVAASIHSSVVTNSALPVPSPVRAPLVVSSGAIESSHHADQVPAPVPPPIDPDSRTEGQTAQVSRGRGNPMTFVIDPERYQISIEGGGNGDADQDASLMFLDDPPNPMADHINYVGGHTFEQDWREELLSGGPSDMANTLEDFVNNTLMPRMMSAEAGNAMHDDGTDENVTLRDLVGHQGSGGGSGPTMARMQIQVEEMGGSEEDRNPLLNAALAGNLNIPNGPQSVGTEVHRGPDQQIIIIRRVDEEAPPSQPMTHPLPNLPLHPLPNGQGVNSNAPIVSSYRGGDGSLNISLAFRTPFPLSPSSSEGAANLTSQGSGTPSTAAASTGSWSSQVAGTMRNIISSIMPRGTNQRNSSAANTAHANGATIRSRSVPRMSPNTNIPQAAGVGVNGPTNVNNQQQRAIFIPHTQQLPPFFGTMTGGIPNQMMMTPSYIGGRAYTMPLPPVGATTFNNGPNAQARQHMPPFVMGQGRPSPLDPLFNRADPLLPCLSHHFVNPSNNVAIIDQVSFVNMVPGPPTFPPFLTNDRRMGHVIRRSNGGGRNSSVPRTAYNVTPSAGSRRGERSREQVAASNRQFQMRAQNMRHNARTDAVPPPSSTSPQVPTTVQGVQASPSLLNHVTSMFGRMTDGEASIPNTNTTIASSTLTGTDLLNDVMGMFQGFVQNSSAQAQPSNPLQNILGGVLGQLGFGALTPTHDASQSTDQSSRPASIYETLCSQGNFFSDLLGVSSDAEGGDTDTVSRFMTYLFKNTDFSTLRNMFLRNEDGMAHLNLLIATFVSDECRTSTSGSSHTDEAGGRGSIPTKLELANLVMRICNESLQFLQDILGDLPTRNNIDLVQTIDAFQSVVITNLLALVFGNHGASMDDNSPDFVAPGDVVDLISTSHRQLTHILREALLDPHRDLGVAVRRALTTTNRSSTSTTSATLNGLTDILNDPSSMMGSLLISWIIDNIFPTTVGQQGNLDDGLSTYFYRYKEQSTPNTNIHGEAIVAPLANSGDPNNLSPLPPKNYAQDKRKIERMEVEDDDNYEDAVSYGSSRTSPNNKAGVIGNNTEGFRRVLDDEEQNRREEDDDSWKSEIPQDWVAIIEKDLKKLRNHDTTTTTAANDSNDGSRIASSSTDTGTVYPPVPVTFSNAYISGMPTKRRKMMEAAQATKLASPYLDEYFRDMLDKALTDAGVLVTLDEFDDIISKMMEDENLVAAFHTMLATKINSQVYGSKDYSNLKYPNIKEYLDRYLP